MNDLMHDELEQELREVLARQASRAQTSPGARAAVQARVAERRSGRRVRRGLGAAAAAAAALGGGLWLQTGPATVGVASNGGDPTAPAPAITEPAPLATPDDEPLPRLALDGEGFVVEHADDYVSAPGIADGIYRQVFRGTANGPAGPTFTIVTVPAGVVYDLGEDAPPEVAILVDVQGRRGVLLNGDSLSPSLGWRLDDGSAVQVKAIGVGGDGLLEIANGLERRSRGPGFAPAEPSMTPFVEGELSYAGASSEVQYRTDRGVRADVRLLEGDLLRFEEVLLDRAGAAVTMQPIEVRGHAGVMFGTEASSIVVWHEGDVIGEVVLVGMSEDEARATLATLHEIAEEEWQALG